MWCLGTLRKKAVDPDFIFLSEYFLQLNLWLLVIGKLVLYTGVCMFYITYLILSAFIQVPSLEDWTCFVKKIGVLSTLFRGEYYQ